MKQKTPNWFSASGEKDVSIIIPLNNNKIEALKQVRAFTEDDLRKEFIYIDDACPQRSFNSILAEWQKKNITNIGRILTNSQYMGFIPSCNEAAVQAAGKYLLFLSTDFIPHSNWIKPLYDLLESNKDIGMVSPVFLNEEDSYYGAIWQNEFVPNKEIMQDVPMFAGPCFMISKELFIKLEGFDKSYIRWEATDLAMNVKFRGLKLAIHPDSKVVWHKKDIMHNVNKTLFSQRWLQTGLMNGNFSKLKLSIFTPSIREQNLPLLMKYIDQYNMGLFDINWVIVMDYDENTNLSEGIAEQLNKPWIKVFKHQNSRSKKGISQCNYALDQIEDGYIWGIADDCIPHPNFFLRLYQIMHKSPQKGVYIVGQRRANGKIIQALPGNIRPCHVDGAQAVIRRDIYGDMKFQFNSCADGMMYRDLFKQYPKEFMFVNEILSYFEVWPNE